MPEDTTQQLHELMLQPKKVEVDDKTVEQHSLDDVVALDKYLEAKKAVAKRGFGLRFAKLEAGGGVQ